MCNGCERPPRGKQATYKRLRRKHNGRQCLYQQIGRENQRPCALRQRRDSCFPALSPPVGCKGTCKRQRMRLFVRRAVRFVCPRFFGRPTGMNFVFIRAGRKRLGRVTLLGSRLLRMASAFGIRISLFAPVFAESNRALLNCTAYAFGSRHTHRKFAAKQRNCLHLWISRFNRVF